LRDKKMHKVEIIQNEIFDENPVETTLPQV
jgi:hypothetical protein